MENIYEVIKQRISAMFQHIEAFVENMDSEAMEEGRDALCLLADKVAILEREIGAIKNVLTIMDTEPDGLASQSDPDLAPPTTEPAPETPATPIIDIAPEDIITDEHLQ